MSLSPSLVNTVVLTGLLQQAGFVTSRLSLEKILALCERRVSLDTMKGLGFLFFISLLFWLVSLSMAWVTREDLPYYPMGNRVVAMRSTSLIASRCAEVNVLIICYPYLIRLAVGQGSYPRTAIVLVPVTVALGADHF
ncbi:hypothetical protein Tco_0777343, partial [Tanacetum coccineum]